MGVVNRLRRGLPLVAIVMMMPSSTVGLLARHPTRVSAGVRHDFGDTAANVLLTPADPRATSAGTQAVETSSLAAASGRGPTTTRSPIPLTPTTSTTPAETTTSTFVTMPKARQATLASAQEATVVVTRTSVPMRIARRRSNGPP